MFKIVSSKNFTNKKLNILKNVNKNEIDILKNKLRKNYKKIRDENNLYYNLNKEEKEIMLNKIEEKLKYLIDTYYKSINTNINKQELIVSCYYPIQNELDGFSIIKKLKIYFENNLKILLKICLPITKEGERILTFYEFTTNNENLKEGKYKIMEPDIAKSNEMIPNIIITPLLAFDSKKHRLGYGKGHFDNTFFNYKEKKVNFISIGIAYDEQFYSDDLPVGEHDQILDYIITPSKYL